ncbi:MAG TPA: hypothetical protein VGK99_05325 [Acidobacteriota bacterium]|jgi:hypothetical protein
MLDIVLLERDGNHFFYFEEKSREEVNDPITPSFRARVKRKLKKAHQAVEQRLSLDERLCSHLRFHDEAVLHAPTSFSEERTAKLFLSFVEECVKKHRRWALADGILAVFGTALVWVPGPNVFFLYPALRALGHYHAQSGGSRHLNPGGPSVRSCSLLDDFSTLAPDKMLHRAELIEKEFGFTQLRDFLRKKYALVL